MDVVMPSLRKGKRSADKEKLQVMKRRRALESEGETLLRKENDKVRKASVRTSETFEQKRAG